jgi:hypothetical protein
MRSSPRWQSGAVKFGMFQDSPELGVKKAIRCGSWHRNGTEWTPVIPEIPGVSPKVGRWGESLDQFHTMDQWVIRSDLAFIYIQSITFFYIIVSYISFYLCFFCIFLFLFVGFCFFMCFFSFSLFQFVFVFCLILVYQFVNYYSSDFLA